MNIRTFQPGDEALQIAIYNQAAATLPAFKPATVFEIQRRTTSRNFDPSTKLFAVEGTEVVGYCTFHDNGRISFPWCADGKQAHGTELFHAAITAMQQRGIRTAFAAYREDWQPIWDFFRKEGFSKSRDMINFLQDIIEMPTVSLKVSNPITPLRIEDIPAVFEMGKSVIRAQSPRELQVHLFRNAYFGPENVFVLRSKVDESPLGVGLLITESTYAAAEEVNPQMPCFWLGAFGTEFMSTKRIKGLLSLLARPDSNFHNTCLDLLGHTFAVLQEHDDICTLATQVPSDATHVLEFFSRHFKRQGSFPVYERNI